MENQTNQPMPTQSVMAEIKYEHNSNFTDIRYAELFISGKKIAHAENGTGEFDKTIKEWEIIVKAVNDLREAFDIAKEETIRFAKQNAKYRKVLKDLVYVVGVTYKNSACLMDAKKLLEETCEIEKVKS